MAEIEQETIVIPHEMRNPCFHFLQCLKCSTKILSRAFVANTLFVHLPRIRIFVALLF